MTGFRGAFSVTILAVAALGAAAVSAYCWAGERCEQRRLALAGEAAATRARTGELDRLKAAQARVEPVERFLAAWSSHVGQGTPGHDLAGEMRTSLEELAQRKLGLITDQATTPGPSKINFGGRPLTVQRVSLRATGESLNALLTWLGEAESLYPYARVECCEIAAGAGGGLSLRLSLAQPLAAENRPGRRP